jgi:hypothetical protein
MAALAGALENVVGAHLALNPWDLSLSSKALCQGKFQAGHSCHILGRDAQNWCKMLCLHQSWAKYAMRNSGAIHRAFPYGRF